MSIHAGAQAFEHTAVAYARARPDYPAAAVDWICDELSLVRTSSVLDLAAGTGKLTALLARRVQRVVAVEPVAGMRAQLVAALPNVEALDGTAEAIPLGDASVDAITVAQAFHWFDAPRAVAECARVGRNGVALLWNMRDERSELQRAYEEIVGAYRGGYPSGADDRRRAFEEHGVFAPVRVRAFEHSQLLDADGLVERFESTSWIARLSEEQRAPLLERVRAIAPEGTFEFPYITEIFVYRRAR